MSGVSSDANGRVKHGSSVTSNVLHRNSWL